MTEQEWAAMILAHNVQRKMPNPLRDMMDAAKKGSAAFGEVFEKFTTAEKPSEPVKRNNS